MKKPKRWQLLTAIFVALAVIGSFTGEAENVDGGMDVWAALFWFSMLANAGTFYMLADAKGWIEHS